MSAFLFSFVRTAVNTPCLFLKSTRLKNIEDTEKAKRVKAEERQEHHHRKKAKNDEEHLVATRCEMSLFCV